MTQARMFGVSHVGRLKEFLDEDRSNKDVLGYLVSDGRSRTLSALKAPDVPAAQTACWLSVISKALRCESDKDMVIDLLTMVLGSRFFSSGITNALSTLARNSSEEDIVIFVQDLVDIINQIFIRLPHSLADVFGHIVIIKKTIDDILPTTTGCNKRRFAVLSDTTESLKETALKRMSAFNRGHGNTKSEPHQPPNDFRTIPILPETSDIFLNSRKVYLRKNKAVGEYESLDHYLDVQFRLYREDCVSPLRDGIAEYVSAVDSGQHISRLQDGKLYKNVVVISRKSAIEGEQYVIKLDKEHASKFNWKSCQRLIYGSLVCLSGDNFRKMHFAVVSDSDREILQVKNEFAVVCPANDILPINTKMTMVESAAFFEAYRHVLAGLQNIGEGELPFEKYIVKCRKDVDPPVYLTKAATEYDLQPIILNQTIFEKSKTLQRESNWRKKEEHDSLKKQYMVQTLSPISQWPKCDKLHLDQSQFEAFHAALTQELVLIQGPPGTGKTHVGLQIAKTLLHNKDVWATDTTTKGGFRVKRKWPMLVVCFTNHALDQFMEGIINFLCPLSKSSWRNEIVRVGGRCENETIEEFSLKKRRRFFRRGRWDEAGTFKTVQSLQQKIADTKYRLRELKSVIFDVLLLHPVMSANNYSAFNHNKFGSHLLFQWLGADETTWLQGAQTAYFQKQLDPTRTAQVENWKAQMQQELLNVKSDADILEDDRRIEDDTVASLTVDKNIGLDMKSIISIMCCQKDDPDLNNSPEMDDVFKMMLTQEVAKTFARVIEKDLMTDKEADLCSKYNLQELASLSFNERWRLYRFWVRKYKEFLNESLTELEEELNEVLKTYAKEKKETDALVLKTATVIAMTTSGAARYHDVLKEIGPRIVIVEEAAEVLETHIVTALSPQCQHLILIGDHKQLEPKPSVYRLEQHYNLGVSMFERMLNNGIENHCLQRQHRMRPDISTLVRDIYPVLEDNENVFEYSHVQGIEKDVFFINHSSPEDFGGDTRSYSNKHEATFVVALCRHLMKQGYATNQITILTAYSGQMFSVRNLMPRNEFEGVRAVAIDNFQGEETDIIILSLVRSNKTGNIGFLKRENRVCVALSRAKMGLYVVGNFSMFEKESPLWANILNKTKSTDQFGNALPICCQNHPDTRNLIADAKDFLKSPDGGCNRKCDFRLPCGHACRFYCHPWDKKHTEYKCKEKCKKTCLNGHQCRKTCHFDKECNCSVKMLKGLKCGHEASMQCYQSPDDYKCRVIVTRMLTCGHEAAMECHKPQEKHTCKVIVDRTFSCGHILPLECHIDPDSIRCDVVVNRTLERCGHDASMKCFVDPGTFKCLITVTRVLESCGHEATMKCNVDVTTYKCTSVVTRKLQACKHTAELECWVNSSQHKCNVMLRKQREKCGHSFDVECSQYSPVYEEETLCKTIVSKRYPRCQHVVDIPCHIKIDCFKCKTIVTKQWDCSHTAELECWDTDNAKCNQKCFKKCSLGHVCHKPCHYPEMCKCKILVEKTLQSCGHVKKMECHMDASRAQCQTYVMKELPCGHATEIECSKDVSQAHCKEIVSKLLALCGHSQDMECSQDPCSFKCAALIDKILPKCGHTMKVKCSADPKREICNTTVLKSLPCGHEMEMKCCTSPKKSVCRAIVQIPRKMCNHTANVECSKVTRIDLDKVKCRTHTQQQLVCGHERMVECWKSTQQTPCDRKCTTILSCGHPCGGKCAKCSANLFHETCRKSCTVSPNELLSKIPLQKETRYISEISVYVTRFRTYLYIQQKLHLGRSVELLVKWAVSFTNMLTQFLTKSCKDTHLTFEQTHSINRNMCKLAAVWLFIIGSQFKSRSKSADWIGKETQQPDSQEMEKIAAEQDVLSKVETLIRKTPTFSTSDLQKVRALLQRVVTNASEAVIAFDFPVLEGLGVHRKDWITCNRDHPTPSDLLSKFYTKSSTTHTILQHGMGLGGEKYKESGKETGSDKVRGKGRWRGQSRQQSTEGKTEDAPMSLFHQVLMQNQFSEDKNKAPIRGHGGKLGKTSVDENRGLVKGSDGSDTTDNKCGRQDTVNNKEESHGTRQLGFNKVGRNSTKVCGGGIDRTDSKEHDGKNESGRGQGGRGRRRRGRGRGRGRDSSDNEEVVRNREKTGHGSDNASKGPRKISEGQDKSEKKANSRVVEEGLDRGRGKSRSAECGDESTVGDGGGNMGGRGGGSRGGRGGGSRGERDEGSSRRGGGSGSNSGRGGDSRGGHGGGSSSGRGGGFGNNSGRDGDSRGGRGGGSSRGRGGDSRGGRSGGSSSGRGGGGGSSSGRGGDSRGGRGGGSSSGRGGDSRGGRGGGSSSGRGGGSGSNGGRGEGSRGGRGGSSSGARGGGSGNNE